MSSASLLPSDPGPDAPTGRAAASEPMLLAVARAEWIAEEIRLFEIRAAGNLPLPAFTAGSHLTVRVPNGLLRKYSLCNDPAESDRYVIAVRRESAGRGGSASLVDGTRVGDRLEVSPPRNAFPLSERAASFVFIAGGIGITPILSMMRHLDATGRRRYRLIYCTRSPASTAFREDLSGPAFRGRVTIHHDDGDPARAFDLWPVLEKPTGAHLYCCGPRGMMQAVRDMTGHWSRSAVHFESFVDGAAMRHPDDRAFRVRLARSGGVVEVPAGVSILEALRGAGQRVRSSCESGSCGSCRTRLLAGEAEHRDLVLGEHEQAGQIMVCVSRARGDELVLDL